MNKHTPGPWEVGPDVIGAVDESRMFMRHIVAKISPARLKRQNVSPAQVAADYRLIAAAPDLLSALETCRAEILACTSACGIGLMSERALDAADAAIAKATGAA